MSMEFSDFNQTGGGGLATGIALGNSMNRRDEDRGTYIWAVIIFAIIFIIAIIALAVMCKDRGYDNRKDYGGTDIAALLTPLIAAKSMDCKNDDKFEIMCKLEHNEDRAQARQTQAELGALGLMLQKTASDNEKTNLENFAKIENQVGMLTMGMTQLLQKENNRDIIQGVITQLAGMPCYAKC